MSYKDLDLESDSDLLEEEDEVTSDEDDLLFSINQGPRVFVLNTANCPSIAAVVMEETDDSFLVAAAARIVESEGEKAHAEAYSPIPYFRIMKGSVIGVMPLFGVFYEAYTPYLISQGDSIYTKLIPVVDYLRSKTESFIDPVVETKGMDDERLNEYLYEKFMKGQLVNGSGSKH